MVVAACTPRTHEPLFRDTLREGGINQYFFDMANIREHCSWVHSKQKEEATQKAKDIVRMSVARTIGLEPLQEFELPVNKTALVVGGGVAGMTSALGLANQGFEVHLVEKEKELGGMARRIRTTLEGLDVQAYLSDLIRQVYQHPLVHVSHEATITDVSGLRGQLRHHGGVGGPGQDDPPRRRHPRHRGRRVPAHRVPLRRGRAGADPARAGGADRRGTTKGSPSARSLVMIQCVGCRQEGRNYCARVCCSQAVKNALELKAAAARRWTSTSSSGTCGPTASRRTTTARRPTRASASSAGSRTASPRWRPAKDEEGKPVLRVTVPDPILGQRLALDADLVVLSAAVVPSAGSPEVARLFKVPVNPDGFFQEAHVKLRPVDFAADGVFLCGASHYPKHLSEAISQAYGAAGRAVTLLSQDTVTASGSVCEVEEDDCVVLRGVHHGLHLRRDRLARDAGGQEGRGQPRPLQGGRPLLRQVPDRRHRPEALHRRGGLQPDRRGAGGVVELDERDRLATSKEVGA